MSSSSSARPPTPQGPGSVSGARGLPDGFASTFISRHVDTGELRQHVVTGGDGPPLLLVHGWPQTWYAWRLVMPALARHFCVVAPDQRGRGLSGKPGGGTTPLPWPGTWSRCAAASPPTAPSMPPSHKPAAHDPAADPARAGHRRSGRLRRSDRGHDEARRGRRAERDHPRLRPLLPRGSPRGDAERAG
jgi:hypothetical protein